MKRWKRSFSMNLILFFTDVEMPRKSGFDVVKEVKEVDIYPTFIFVTGYDQYAIKAIKNAAFDFLLKPVDVDDLNETIVRFKTKNQPKNKSDLGKEDEWRNFRYRVKPKRKGDYPARCSGENK